MVLQASSDWLRLMKERSKSMELTHELSVLILYDTVLPSYRKIACCSRVLSDRICQLSVLKMRRTLTCFSSDPQGTRTDAELISALQRAWLLPKDGKEDKASDAKFSLDSDVGEEGGNFSAGERQLVALCRALVKDSRIIVMVCTCTIARTVSYSLNRMKRRPTSTWRLIQRSKRPRRQNSKIGLFFVLPIGSTPSVRSYSFRVSCTKTLTISGTVYYDRVLVLDGGRVAEYDTPLALFDNEDSIFRSLCREAGLNRADIVRIRSTAGIVREE